MKAPRIIDARGGGTEGHLHEQGLDAAPSGPLQMQGEKGVNHEG